MEKDKKETEKTMAEPDSLSPARKKKHSLFVSILDYILIAFVAVVAIGELVGFFTKSSNYGVPNIFGYQYMVVLTDSMAEDSSGNPVYPVGDGLIVKKVGLDTINKGDDITFYWPSLEAPITHRVYQIDYEADGTTLKDFLCHGINVNATNYSPDQYQTVLPEYVIGKVIASSMTLGGFITTMQKPWVIFLLIIIPSGLIAASSVYDIVKLRKEPVNDKPLPSESDSSPLAGLSEEDRKRLKEQMLREMLDKQEKKDR